MSMKPYFTKAAYIFKEEGLLILLKRMFRYVIYLIRRAVQDSKSDINKWKELKDKYAGQRAFLIGNGPSLNKTPLHLLKNEFTICFNRFDLMLERLGWTPTAYSVIDDLVLDDIADIANEMSAKTEYAFFPDIHPSAPVTRNFKKSIKERENVYWLHLGDIGFTDNLPKCGINKTVANVAVQILVYMGFSEIYFIGVDLDYKIPDSTIQKNKRDLKGGEDDDSNHFDPRYFGKGRKYHVPRMEETFQKFKEAADFLKATGVKGYNASIGGKLEYFERVDFNSLFEYSGKEELELMIGHLKDEINSEKLDEIFPEALVINEEKEWDDNFDEIICPYSLGHKIIPKKVLSYKSFGPYRGKYLFLKKSKYEQGQY